MVTYKGHTYSNGNVPKALLAPLDGENFGDAMLRLDAAASWNRARAEVKEKTGIVLTVRGWNRSLAEQERFFFERYSRQATGGGPFGDVRWYKGVRYVRTSGAPAAIPGNSNHGWGLAVDINDFGAYRTAGNARSRLATPILEKHGWTDDEGSSIGEPWHRVYKPERDTQKNAKPATPIQEVPDMDTTQAKQLSDIHAALPKLVELWEGIAPQVPVSATKDPERITLRAAVRDIRIAVTRQMDDAVAQGVAVALQDVSGVDKEALTAGIVAEVSKAVHAVTESVAGTEYVMTPKETDR
jgi:hypothetical protein